MAKHVNLARMIVSGGGTGPLTLVSASPGSLSFSDAGVSNGDVVSYGIRTEDHSEVGYGTYNAGVLTRTTVVNSTNGGAPINVTGAGEVFITLLAQDLSPATPTADGFMAAADKAKLDGIAAGATANATDAQLRNRGTHTGTQAISTVAGLQTALDGKVAATKAAISSVLGGNPVLSGSDDASIGWDAVATKATFTYAGTSYNTTWPINITGEAAHAYSSTYAYSSARLDEQLPSYYTDIPARLGFNPATRDVATTAANGLMAAADKAKLDGIAAGATANATDAQLRARSTHTGTQDISTVAGLQTALDSKAATTTNFAAGSGLTGGGTLAANRSIALSAASIASLAKADAAVLHSAQTLTTTQKGQAIANIGADALAGFRNKIINGEFEVRQRGDGPFSVSANSSLYTADRWVFTSGAGSSNTITFPVVADRDGKNVLNWVRNTTGTVDSIVAQRIEDVRTLKPGKATLSFWKFGTGLSVRVRLVYGSGGSTAVTLTLGSVLNLSAWQKFTFSFDVPALSGKTIGPNSYVELQFIRSTSNNGNAIQISRVSLVEGDATAEEDPFSPRHIQQEFALCQRYYQISSIYAGAYYNTTVATVAAVLPVQMRTSPTIILRPGATALEPGITTRPILSAFGVVDPNGGQIDITTAAITNVKPTCFAVMGAFGLDAEI